MNKTIAVLTLCLASCTAAQPVVASEDSLRSWTTENPNHTHRLVGLGCGPQRRTMTAVEEDHFPAPCYAVGVPRELCPDDMGDYPEAYECARYLGDGW